MRRRDKFEDRSSLGRSDVVPFQRNEGASSRHARRLATNLKCSPEISTWVKSHTIELKITNEGHHWRIIGKGRLAEWWPSSAKLVLDRTYESGIHAHDYKQVMRHLEKAWGLNGSPESRSMDGTSAKAENRGGRS